MNPKWRWREDLGLWLMSYGPFYWWVKPEATMCMVYDLRILCSEVFTPQSEMVQ